MADLIHDLTEVDATRQEAIAAMVQMELAAQAKVAPLLTDVSEFATKGRKSIEFPKLGSFVVQKLGENQRADAQALAATTDKLALTELAIVQWIMKKQAEMQSTLKWEDALLSRAASAHARGLDKDLLDALIDGAAAGNAVTYNAGAIEGNVLDVVKALDEANAPEENRFLVFRPKQKKLLLQVANFVQAERYGSNIPLVSGEIGMAYGLRFVMSSIQSDSFVDDVMVGFHKEAACYGFQYGPEVDEQKAIEYGAGSKRMTVDQLYGVKSLQGGLLASVVS